MITVDCYVGLFTNEIHKRFYRDGVCIAWKDGSNPIELAHSRYTTDDILELTRSKAYKYWERIAPDAPYWVLPEWIQYGLDLDDHHYIAYNMANGEILGTFWK